MIIIRIIYLNNVTDYTSFTIQWLLIDIEQAYIRYFNIFAQIWAQVLSIKREMKVKGGNATSESK